MSSSMMVLEEELVMFTPDFIQVMVKSAPVLLNPMQSSNAPPPFCTVVVFDNATMTAAMLTSLIKTHDSHFNP